ncbi:protein STRUBBELIG-RECEPTOR FAMILY 1 [Capsicum chacoense]
MLVDPYLIPIMILLSSMGWIETLTRSVLVIGGTVNLRFKRKRTEEEEAKNLCSWSHSMSGLYVKILFVFAIFVVQNCQGFTDPRDVFAINSLYTSLGYPLLPGWVPYGLDPCGDQWHGVLCVNSNLTGIVLNDSNLGGELNEGIGSFASIIQMSLNNNHLKGVIPDAFLQLKTLTTMDLSRNNLSGQLPLSIGILSSLTTLNIENNLFSEPIPPKLLSIPSFSDLNNHESTRVFKKSLES